VYCPKVVGGGDAKLYKDEYVSEAVNNQYKKLKG